MPDNGIDFEKRYGKPASKMDEGEWRMALISLLCEYCSMTQKHEKAYWIVVIGGPILATILTIIATAFLAHLGAK
jgi:hypothetical protein